MHRMLCAGASGSRVVVLALLVAAGCASPPAAIPPERVVGDVEDYEIGVPDVLNVTVWRQPEVSGTVVVRRDGKISVPLAGDVQAEGLTPEELADVIAQQLAEFISAPQVDVAVAEMRSQMVSVIGGGVSRSGVVQLQRNTRIIDAIASMGGFTPFAQKDEIRVLRNTDEGQVEYRFDYEAFIKGRAPDSNMLLEPGDTVVVPD